MEDAKKDLYRVEYERTERRIAWVFATSKDDAEMNFMDWENIEEDVMDYGIEEDIKSIEKEDD